MRDDLPLTALMVDPENPRLETQPSSREALRELFRNDRIGMMELARDIAERGQISPLEKIGVYEAPKHAGRFIVAEGNRRVAALMALNTPDLLKGAITPAALTRLHSLSDEFMAKDPADTVECEILPKSELQNWMALRHTAAAGARGIVRWGPVEQQRFLERTGSQKSVPMQFIDFYAEYTRGNSTEAEIAKNIPLTTFKRLLDAQPVREALGIQVSDEGIALSNYPPDQTFRWLHRVFHDLSQKKITSRGLNKVNQMLKYLDDFSPHERPDPEKKLPQPVPVEPLARAPVSSKKQVKKPPPRPWSLKGLKLRPANQRLREMVEELEQVSIAKAPNVHGIMLRVFVELSTDEYVKHYKIPKPAKEDWDLKHRVTAAVEHLRVRGLLDSNEAAAAKKSTNNKRFHSTDTLHELVHNPTFHCSPDDVASLWKNFSPYLVALQDRS